MKTALIDINLLIALSWPNHEHHLVAKHWFKNTGRKNWASCPMTQAGFIRISSNPVIVEDAASPFLACQLFEHLTTLGGHQFWPDTVDLSVVDTLPFALMQGHRQITDAYLIMLAQAQGGYLATMDRKIANALRGSEYEGFVQIVGSGS